MELGEGLGDEGFEGLALIGRGHAELVERGGEAVLDVEAVEQHQLGEVGPPDRTEWVLGRGGVVDLALEQRGGVGEGLGPLGGGGGGVA